MLEIDYRLSSRDKSLHLYTIADSCNMAPGWKATSRKGDDIIIRFNSSSVTETTVIIGSYSTFTWDYYDVCPEAARVADASQQTVEYPGPGLMIFGEEGCSWSFRTPDENGRLRLTLSSESLDEPGNDNQRCLNPDAYLYVEDSGVSDFAGLPHLKNFRVPSCDIASGFEYVAVGNLVTVTKSFWGWDTMTPGIRLGYSAAPANWTCPASTSPMPLQAAANVTSFFKGVNPLSAAGTDDAPRDCAWEISAPSPDMVVKVLRMTIEGYSCSEDNRVTLPGGQTVAINRDLDYYYRYFFPRWSANQTLLFGFSTASGCSGDQRFAVSYTAVPKNDCQGWPVMLTATGDAKTVVGKGPTYNGYNEEYDCRWLLRTKSSDMVVQATVTDRSIDADDGPFHSRWSSLRASCGDNCDTRVFTSSGDTLLLRLYGSDRGDQHGDVTITYKAVDKAVPPKEESDPESDPAGGAESTTASKLVLVTISMAVLTFVSV